MNTLPRAVTAQIFPTPDSYNALQCHWSSLNRSERRHDLSAAHYLLYQALRGKDWRKAFTCPSNPRKLANGAFAGWVLFCSLNMLHSRFSEEALLAPFDGLVTLAMLETVRRLLPAIRTSYPLRPEQFAGGAFPFDAYLDKGTLNG